LNLPPSKRHLVDVNVCFAWLVNDNANHHKAKQWFATLDPEAVVLCRSVQISVLRLLSDARIMGAFSKPSPMKAWQLVTALCDDDRVVFAPEPSNWENAFPPLLYDPRPAPKLVADAYLAAFAIAGGFRLVSFDSGFRQFKDLDFLQL
jgi:uncharacterized protein